MTDEETTALIHATEETARTFALRYFKGDPEVAEDAVQEWACQVWACRDKLDAAQNPRAYVIGKINNVLFQHIRSQRKQRGKKVRGNAWKEADSLMPVPETKTEGEHGHLRDLEVRKAFDQLPTHLYVVALLAFVEGRGLVDLARCLGLSRPVARQRLDEVTRKLRWMLREWR